MILLRRTSVELWLVGITQDSDWHLSHRTFEKYWPHPQNAFLYQSPWILQIPFPLWTFSSRCWLLVLLDEKEVASIHRWPSLATYVTLSLARRNDSDTAPSDFRKTVSRLAISFTDSCHHRNGLHWYSCCWLQAVCLCASNVSISFCLEKMLWTARSSRLHNGKLMSAASG